MSSLRSPEERRRLLEQHRAAVRDLEAEERAELGTVWAPDGIYWIWNLVVGITLGGLGAAMSLALNFAGAPMFGKQPMELIRVYLTFPMGEQALVADEGRVLTVGCLLYLVTGAFYGIVFHLLMRRFRGSGFLVRLGVATAFGLGLWIVNFYLILSWLQPLLLGGNWIVRLVPVWVAALTHLAFTWTMLVGEPWTRFRGGGLAP